MKKIISVLLAVAMLAALTVPAFAADITISKDEPAAGPDGAQKATVDVVTKTTNTEGADAYTYSVTFPASFEFAWGDTNAKSATYTVTSQLLLGASLDVSVAANNGGEMTNENTASTLTYTLTNGGSTHFTEVNNSAAPTAAPSVSVAKEEYDGVPIAAYTGTLTYTVTYNAPTP